jgi:hypothetical protein
MSLLLSILLLWCFAAASLAAMPVQREDHDENGYRQTFLPTNPSFGHQTGQADGPWWMVDVADKAESFMTYGPYLTGYPTNTPMAVDFTLSVDNNNNDSMNIAALSVVACEGACVLAQQQLIRTDFEVVAPATQVFTLFFVTPANSSEPLEFRVFYACCAEIVQQKTVLRQLLDRGPTGLLWNDTAHLSFISKQRFPTANNNPATAGANVGFFFVPSADGKILYLFHREYFFQAQPSYCKADYARILVRSSVDGGRTFSSNFTVVATPTPNSPFECAIVDGAAHYDASKNSWVYLGQCLARDEVWNMCLFTLSNSATPFGEYVPSPANPVVRSGQLWSRICAPTRPSHCNPSTMGSEGTPDIPFKDDQGYYYVTFHGWDPTHSQAARGVAKTLDFVSWVTNGAGLPGDAMFTSLDCNKWSGVQWASGGCVGSGEGTILVSGDMMYQLIEAPDITLGCETTIGVQNWVLGLSRAPRGAFLSTGQWQQFPVSPLVVPIIKSGCYIQYHRIFYFNATLYVTYWADNWLQIFALTGKGPFTSLPIIAGPPPTTTS